MFWWLRADKGKLTVFAWSKHVIKYGSHPADLIMQLISKMIWSVSILQEKLSRTHLNQESGLGALRLPCNVNQCAGAETNQKICFRGDKVTAPNVSWHCSSVSSGFQLQVMIFPTFHAVLVCYGFSKLLVEKRSLHWFNPWMWRGK